MSQVVEDVLAGRQVNHLLPFLWMRGEDESAIRIEMANIDAAGMKAVCLESRPHPDFCGPRWWRDVDVVMEEARRRDMRVWVLDDAHFPTGYARGWIRDRFPELRKLFLAQRHMDVVGPVAGAALLLHDGANPAMGWVREGERLIAAVAARRTGGNSVDPAVIDLMGKVDAGRLWWDIPAGHWRVYFIVETRTGGNLPDYINPIDPESCRVLIDAVYEPHFERYCKDFGRTFAGFFSDEPSIANSGSYDDLIGRAQTLLPWRSGMLESLVETLGVDAVSILPGLWCDIGPRTWEIRFAFMDLVSKSYGESFSGQIGAWCRAHHVDYIGHIIEDNNAHARLGGGVAHFHRAQQGQDMAGIDVVLWQIKPGQDTQSFAWIAGEADGEFFHYGLAKMASSLGHIDPRKRGRTMCEIMGAYGWSAGLRLMTWITNHMLVRGVNVFVPHAFSMAAFPDSDCPPHFRANGMNPQFRHFPVWSAYANRMCHLFSGGTHLATAAVLYHAEAEWSGACMLFQKPVRLLMQHQIDCDVIPIDVMRSGADVRNGALHINGERYTCFVVPYAQRLPIDALRIMRSWMEAGLLVVFVDAVPEGTSQSMDASGLIADIVSHRHFAVVPLDALAHELRRRGHGGVLAADYSPFLRTYQYRTADRADLLMLFNEDPTATILTTLDVSTVGTPRRYDAFTNEFTDMSSTDVAGGQRLEVRLEAGEAMVVVFGPYISTHPGVLVKSILTISGPWMVSTATASQYPNFTPWRLLDQLENLHAPGRMADFSGTIRYETTFIHDDERISEIDLGSVYDIAEVYLNDEPLGTRISPPYRFMVPDHLLHGENRLVIEVTNSLVYQQLDWFSQYHQMDPFGLIGPVSLKIRQRSGSLQNQSGCLGQTNV
jgi:hypothetical protein